MHVSHKTGNNVGRITSWHYHQLPVTHATMPTVLVVVDQACREAMAVDVVSQALHSIITTHPFVRAIIHLSSSVTEATKYRQQRSWLTEACLAHRLSAWCSTDIRCRSVTPSPQHSAAVKQTTTRPLTSPSCYSNYCPPPCQRRQCRPGLVTDAGLDQLNVDMLQQLQSLALIMSPHLFKVGGI